MRSPCEPLYIVPRSPKLRFVRNTPRVSRRKKFAIPHPNPEARDRPGVTYTTFEQSRLQERGKAAAKSVSRVDHSAQRWSNWSKRNVSLFQAFTDSDDVFVRFLEGQFEAATLDPNGAAAGRIFERLVPQRLAQRIGEMAVGEVTGEATDTQLGKRLLGELERRLTAVVGSDALEEPDGRPN